jgi:hypothetical protein
MTAIIQACHMGKRYGRRAALSDCTLNVPAGRVVSLEELVPTCMEHDRERAAAARPTHQDSEAAR